MAGHHPDMPVRQMHPFVKLKMTRFLRIAREERGVEVLVFSTVRTAAEQAARYALGRTTAGPNANDHRPLGLTVTNEPPGRSLSELGLAFDCCPLLGGIPVTFTRQHGEWRLLAALGEVAQDARVNLQWGMREENPPGIKRAWCFYYTAGFTIEELLAGAELPPIPG